MGKNIEKKEKEYTVYLIIFGLKEVTWDFIRSEFGFCNGRVGR